MVKLIFLSFGVLFLVALFGHIGIQPILQAVSDLGPLALAIILLPMILVYALEALGWHLTLGSYAGKVGFGKLFAIRMAGESINVTTPTAYMGGEPFKAMLLEQYGVPLVKGFSSVVTAKTTMILAEVFFILIGLGLGFGVLETSDHSIAATLIGLALMGCGILAFFLMQRYGLATGVLHVLDMIRLRLKVLESVRTQCKEFDQITREFYTERRRTFFLALLIFFIAWLTEAVEVYAILYYLGEPINLIASVSIAALAVLIKGGMFFIPGSLGGQEGGYMLLLLGYGYPDVTGITFALIRRLREIVWILLGFICFMFFKRRKAVTLTEPIS